jgi:hypothetical protein
LNVEKVDFGSAAEAFSTRVLLRESACLYCMRLFFQVLGVVAVPKHPDFGFMLSWRQ